MNVIHGNVIILVDSHQIGMGMIAPSISYKIQVALKADDGGKSLYLSEKREVEWKGSPKLIQTTYQNDYNFGLLLEKVDDYTVRIKSIRGYYIGR